MAKPDPSRFATLALWLAWGWFAMLLTHELSHVLVGTLSGAALTDLEMRPWHLPHSSFAFRDEAQRLWTLWAGPVLGSLAPLMLAALWRRPMTLWIAWFCVLANATYLLLGYFSGDPELDTARLLQAGARPWQLALFVVVALPPSYTQVRRGCINLLSGSTPPLGRRGWWCSAVILLLLLVGQAVAASVWRP